MGQKTKSIFKRAKVNLEKGNDEKALRLFNEVLNREPSHKKALRNKGLIKLLNNGKEAEEFLLFAIDQQPEDDKLYQMLGSFYHNREQPQKALAQFRKSIDINEDNVLSHIGLGMLYAHQLNEHDKAVDHFTKAIVLDADSADVFFNRGCSHMILQNMEKAKEDLQRAEERGNEKAEGLLKKYFS